MDIVRLTDVDIPLFEAFRDVYTVSFPIYEQRTDIQQREAFSSSHYHLDCYMESERFVGFIAYWTFDEYVYVEHFAINPEMRGCGLGGKILNALINSENKRVILEIDPVTDEMSLARMRFYKSYGFSENAFPHIHPAYRKEYPGHNLLVLTTYGQATAAEYARFFSDLETVIMK